MDLKKSRKLGFLATILALALVSASELDAQLIGGRLLDAASDGPIQGGTLLLISSAGDTVSRATSVANGSYLLNVPGLGSYQIVGVRIGFQTSAAVPINVASAQQTVDIRLHPQAVQLEGVEVQAAPTRRRGALGGFYEREQRQAFGTFISREELERFPHSELSDIVSAAGVRIRDTPGGGMTFFTGQGCLKLVIDGVRMQDDMMSHPDELVSAADIEGVEIYRSFAHVPGRFVGPFNECGAILVWTRYSR